MKFHTSVTRRWKPGACLGEAEVKEQDMVDLALDWRFEMVGHPHEDTGLSCQPWVRTRGVSQRAEGMTGVDETSEKESVEEEGDIAEA